MAKENMITRARDELFSHINRCGVLQAEEEDQQHWMEETIDYLAERYPDLTDADLQDLSSVGMRFCQPAIPHGRKRFGFDPREKGPEPKAAFDPEVTPEELVPQEAGAENTLQES
ncbi:MAG: hypothetical protein MUO50_14655 [Longimicrobiales bacterium]|nr:hypothetical protein [Longimicrobiales bacterium]